VSETGKKEEIDKKFESIQKKTDQKQDMWFQEHSRVQFEKKRDLERRNRAR
jgi:hypothetical protein